MSPLQVEELNKLWRRYPQDTFDVFHLTGHADHKPESPYTPFFITESLTGEREDTSAEDLLRVFQQRRPRLMFLSGCRTGQASQEGTVPSLAETLVQKGMPAVMGWGRPVLDTTATQAAARLYESLAAGDPLAQSLSITYRELIKNQVKGWHLLRLYVRGEAWGAVVKPPGDYVPPLEQVQDQFLDHQGLVRVATPDQFVGRRRILQQALRGLRTSLGVILHGMGGVGKSTVAARLLERLPDYQPIVIFQGLDAAKLERLLRLQCLSPKGREILEIPEDRLPFMQRLTAFLDQGLNTPEQRFLFVLDDFEANLELRGGQQVLKTEVVEVLNALLQALSRSKSPHRLLMTSRYDVQFPQLDQRLTRVPLASLQGADLQKKCDRLVSFQKKPDADSSLQAKALTLADGNPRLLEWLDKVLQVSGVDSSSILNSMEGKAAKFREDILAEKLLEQQSEEVQQMLARMQVFELPVPYLALLSICQDINALEQCCQRATSLGLLEHNASSSESFYRLPRILIPLLTSVETEALYQSGLEELYRLWWAEREGCSEDREIELIRLATLAKNDKRLNELGSILGDRWHEQGRYRDAIRLWEPIVEARQKLWGNTSLDFAHSLNELAALYDNQGRYEEAEPLYVKALEIAQKLHGNEHVTVANILNNLALLYDNQGRYEEAKPFYVKAFKMKQKLHGNEHVTVANTLNNLALLFYNQERFEEAAPLFIQALEMRQKLLGNEHPDVANSFINLAQLYSEIERYTEAEFLFIQALQMYQKLLGNEHPDVASSLNNLAQLYAKQGRYEEAKSCLRQALKIVEKALGPEHSTTKVMRNNLESLP